MRRLQVLTMLGVTLAAGCALRGGPRTGVNDWSHVLSLTPGADVIVQYVEASEAPRDPTAVRGRLLAADPGGISLRSTAGDVRVGRAAVERVAIVTGGRNSMTNGRFIGAVIGATYGLIVTSRGREDLDAGAADGIRSMTTGAGAAVGAWADAKAEGRKTRVVYAVIS